jgi:hypothetical protein
MMMNSIPEKLDYSKVTNEGYFFLYGGYEISLIPTYAR